MAIIGDLVTRLGVDGRKFQSGLNKARGQARSFASDVTKIVSGIAIYDITKTGVLGIKDMLVETVRLSATAEVMRGEFAVLLGDVGKSAAFFEKLEQFAARTSFSLESAGDSARQLMAAGVGQNSLIDTMQLLGDLSLGDANRLGFLSKAYTDVFNKGRLQGQEIKQFAENGVGIVAALASSLGKTAGEVLKMSEAGEISFVMMQDALKGLTAEGGRFYNAMATRNSTLMGQWDSLMEGIQKTGRAIGDSMLPQIKGVVVEVNAMLGKFNELPNRMEFIGNVVEAAFDVAFLNIKANWDRLLADMTKGTLTLMRDFGFEMINGPAMQGIEMMAGLAVAGGDGQANAPNNLADAQGRLDALLGQLQGPPAAAENAGAQAAVEPRFKGDSEAIKNLNAVYAEWDRMSAEISKMEDSLIANPTGEALQALEKAREARRIHSEQIVPAAHAEVKKEKGGTKLREGVSSLWESLQSPLAEAQMAAEGMWERGKIKANAAMGTLSNLFTGDSPEKMQKAEPRLAGAMEKGSQEAYSTIVQAMIRQADPVVKATKEASREVVKAIKNQPSTRLAYVAAFEGVNGA